MLQADYVVFFGLETLKKTYVELSLYIQLCIYCTPLPKKSCQIFTPYHIYHSEKWYLEYEKLLYEIYQKIKGETFDLENIQFDKLGQLGWKLWTRFRQDSSVPFPHNSKAAAPQIFLVMR